jgi:hypothetical protein
MLLFSVYISYRLLASAVSLALALAFASALLLLFAP